MTVDYKNWRPKLLPERELAALATLTEAWHLGSPIDNDHALFKLVRAGWPAGEAQSWIHRAQSEAPLLLTQAERSLLLPALAAVVSLVAHPRTEPELAAALRATLADLERLVAYLHASFDPASKQVSRAELRRALDVDDDRLGRAVHLANLGSSEVLALGVEPLYWASFEAFLDRALPRATTTVASVAPLPIEGLLQEVRWSGLGPYRAPTSLRLSPMTVLVGANGAGKTTALIALALLRDLARGGFELPDAISERIRDDANELTIGANVELVRPGAPATETVAWDLLGGLTGPRPVLKETLARLLPAPAAELARFESGTGRWLDERGDLVEHTMSPGALALTTATAPTAHWQLMAVRQTFLRSTVHTHALARSADDRATTRITVGDGYRDDPAAWNELRRHVRYLTGVRDLAVGDDGELLIEEADGVRLDAHLAGRGVVRTIGILGGLLAPVPPRLVAIDELENFLHADLAARLLDVLRSLSHRSRIVVTTHAGRILRGFQPDEVRVVRRGERGSTIVELAEEPVLGTLARLSDVGDLVDDGYFAGQL